MCHNVQGSTKAVQQQFGQIVVQGQCDIACVEQVHSAAQSWGDPSLGDCAHDSADTDLQVPSLDQITSRDKEVSHSRVLQEDYRPASCIRLVVTEAGTAITESS